MSALVKQNKKKQPPVKRDAQRSKFNRLLKKVATLKDKIESSREILDEALNTYIERVLPAKKDSIKVLEASIKSLYRHHKNRVLNESKNAALKEMIEEKIQDIYGMISFGEVDPEISVIYQELTGINHQEVIEKELEQEKRETEEMFHEETGVKIDLSKVDLNIHDDEFEIQRKVLEALREAAQAHEENEEEMEEKPKSKSALIKELKAKELEELQKKGVGTLYKQLAKVLHPDLESCPTKKVEKEGWMKQLTVAYENEDFHALLSLQLECMDLEQCNNSLNKESFALYNSVLEDQIDELEMMESALIASPRYFCFRSYFMDGLEDITELEGILEDEYENYINCAEGLADLELGLNGKNFKKVLEDFVDEFLEHKNAENFDGFDLDGLDIESIEKILALISAHAR